MSSRYRHSVSVRLEDDMWQALHAYASLDGVYISRCVRAGLLAFIQDGLSVVYESRNGNVWMFQLCDNQGYEAGVEVTAGDGQEAYLKAVSKAVPYLRDARQRG